MTTAVIFSQEQERTILTEESSQSQLETRRF